MAFVFKNYSLTFPGAGVATPLDITVHVQATDRYTALRGVAQSVVVQIATPQLLLLPLDYDGFVVERSDDGGINWSQVSGVVRDSFFWVDAPAPVGTLRYRARMRVAVGTLSSPGSEVEVVVNQWGDADEMGLSEVDVANGNILTRLPRANAFPVGFDGEPHTGMSVAEGSMAGGHGEGAWYVRSREFEPPRVYGHAPACGTPAVPLPLTVITLKLQDLPYPTGGSGIDDTQTVIWLGVTSQSGGALLKVRDGATQPNAPTITCAVVPGVDPLLDRDVTITVPAGYINPLDTVTVKVFVVDLDGNVTTDLCEFVMEYRDDVPPVISDEDPECGTGVDASDSRRVRRDTSFSFEVTDPDTGVDTSTLDVFYGPSSSGPWTQVLNNGTTWLGGFTGSIIPITDGYEVTVNRPVADPLWPADSVVCFLIQVDDNQGNSAEKTCCFRTEDVIRITRIVPIAEDILFVEFNVPLSNDHPLRNAQNYAISPLEAADPVTVKEVLPHQFEEAADPENPFTRLGAGDPAFIYLHTTPQTPWATYQLSITPNELQDRYGLDVPALSGDFRAKRTKVDEHRDTHNQPLARDDSSHRRLLIGIAHADEVIGGNFISDDFEEE